MNELVQFGQNFGFKIGRDHGKRLKFRLAYISKVGRKNSGNWGLLIILRELRFDD